MPSAKSKNGITLLLDKNAFAKLSYYGQWEEIIRTVQLEGNLEAIPVMVIHLIWSAIQFGIFWNITKYCGGDDLQQFSIQHWNLIVKNLILYCFITATLAINGMYQGPLLGEPFFRLTALRFMPGTIKEPFFSFFGNRRTVLDVVLYISTIGTAVWVMITPNPTKLQVRGYLAVVGLQWATDYACWVGSDGMFHGVLAFALCSMYGGLTFDGTLNRTMDDYRGGVAAMQLFLGYLYFGCGMGKMGIWFSRVFVQEWTTPPWAVGNIFLRNLFYKDVEGKDYNPTKFSTVLERTRYFLSQHIVLPRRIISLGTPQTEWYDGEKRPSYVPQVIVPTLLPPRSSSCSGFTSYYHHQTTMPPPKYINRSSPTACVFIHRWAAPEPHSPEYLDELIDHPEWQRSYEPPAMVHDDSTVYRIESQYIVDPTKLFHLTALEIEPFDSTLSRVIVPLQELIRRNFIKEYHIDGYSLDPRSLEDYLSDGEFLKVFRLKVEDFKQLTLWKQKEMKKHAHLF